MEASASIKAYTRSYQSTGKQYTYETLIAEHTLDCVLRGSRDWATPQHYFEKWIAIPEANQMSPALQVAALRHVAPCLAVISQHGLPPSLPVFYRQLCSSSPYESLAPGSTFTLTKQFSASDVSAFVQLSGDHNPIHTQLAAAKAAGLPGCILPGMLSASLFPAIIGSNFPGAVYLSQTLKFKHYALVGDTLTATVEVVKASGSRVSFATLCRAGSSEPIVEGTAIALLPRQGQGQQQHTP